MKRIGGVFPSILVVVGFVLVANHGFAVGGNEIERLHFTCPEDADSLAECTYHGTYTSSPAQGPSSSMACLLGTIV